MTERGAKTVSDLPRARVRLLRAALKAQSEG
jgi:hypothetical protein